MVKRFCVAALATVMLAALSGQVSAYFTSGHRWPTSQVPFYINPVNLDVSANAAVAALQSAASNWSAQSAADLTLYYAGSTTGSSIVNNRKNEIFFRNTSSGSTIGVTYYWWGGDGKLIDADMMFYDGGFKFFTGQSGCTSGVYLEDIATHEFGHFVGIGHSADGNATMYPSTYGSCNQSWRYLAQDDVNAVLFLYPSNSSATSAPSAPTGAAASLAATTPNVNVTWQDTASNETGFIVERSTDGVNFAAVWQPGVNVQAYLDQSTAAGVTYRYRIRAFNANGTSAASSIASIQIPSVSVSTTLGAANVFRPVNGASGVTSAVTNGYYVRWSAVPGATSYDVYYGTTSNPPMIGTVTPPAGVSVAYPGTLYKSVSWHSRKTYYWRIVAKNGSAATSSPTWKFTTK